MSPPSSSGTIPERHSEPTRGYQIFGAPLIEQVHVPATERETVYDVNLPVTVEGSPEPWGPSDSASP
jgi:hypothetical protein